MEIQLVVEGSHPWELWMKHWGLSFLIDRTILFDTFANYRALGIKLKKANIDVAALDTVVISHNHWDHIGGLPKLAETRRGMTLYLPPAVNEATRTKLRERGCTIVDSSTPQKLKDKILLTGCLATTYDGKEMLEQALTIQTDKGLVLVVGCSHPGIQAMVAKAKALYGGPVRGIVGGLHFMESSKDAIHKAALALKDEKLEFIAPLHCTGSTAQKIFRDVFGETYRPLKEGDILTI